MIKKLLPLTLICFTFSSPAALAQNAMVNMPRMHIQTDANGGAIVNMPGMNIDTTGGQTHVRTQAPRQVQPQAYAQPAPQPYTTNVQAPGLNIQTGGQAGTTVRAPGMHVQTGGQAGTMVRAPGMQVQTGAAPATTNAIQIQGMNVPTQITAQAGRGMSFVNADLKNKDFSNKYLVGADFTNADLTNVDFSGADLRKARFVNADLTNANMKGALLMSADFTNASFIRTNLVGANLTNANLTNVGIDGALATGAIFTNAILTNVDIKAFVIQRTQPQPMAAPAPQKTAVMQKPAAQKPAAPKAPAFKAPDQIKQALEMKKGEPKKAKKVDLTINFELDSDMLTGSGLEQVKAVGEALASPELKGSYIIVEGHTDNVGNEAYNDELSYRRAMRVLFTLRDQYGIPHKMLQAKGFGEKNPIASNKSDIGRAMNRRVTIVNMGK